MSNKKIVIIVTHGMGKQDKKPRFSLKYDTIFDKAAKRFEKKIRKRFIKEGGDDGRLVFAPVNWADVAQKYQTELKENLMKRKKRLKCDDQKIRAKIGWRFLRGFMVDFLADAIVYQQSPNDQKMYNDIHAKFSEELKKQATGAGDNAHLCIFAHSLGTIITNNFLFDLEYCRKNKDPSECGDTPLERGETLKLVYTAGSPLALWTIRHYPPKFGIPIEVEKWINFYNKNDVLAYPLGNLNEEYRKLRCNAEEGKKPMLIDKKVFAGGVLMGWNPMSHNGYWSNRNVIKTIVENLLEI
ncbi:MAG: hypothetical protein V3V41_00665 [Candidatus Heimdallarchaeota archaeon]